jgi:diadenylate cyclase
MVEEVTGEVRTQEDRRPRRAPDAAAVITDGLLRYVPGIVESCGATALFLYVDAVDGEMLDLSLAGKVRIFCVTASSARERQTRQGEIPCVHIPNVPLTRIGQVKIAVFLALSRGLIQPGDRIVFLSGPAAPRMLDTITVIEIGWEYEVFAPGADLTPAPAGILPEVIERVADIASELGSEGREGRPVGAMFVIGDTDRVLPMTHQLLLNPFRGYPPTERNILDYSLEETVKELATLDGAFIVQGDGVMETCGTYIRTGSQQEINLPKGLGARHYAAAAITAVTDSIAVTVSESTGSITIFRHGRIITQIEKPRSTGDKALLLRSRLGKPKKPEPAS